MYDRYLNDNDYLSLLTKEAIQQLTRGEHVRFEMAEMSAEMSIIEYLSNNFEIEKTLFDGKMIKEYNNQITYPVNAHFYKNGVIYKVIKTINGISRPSDVIYWEEVENVDEYMIRHEHMHDHDHHRLIPYSQLRTYQEGDLVFLNKIVYRCLVAHGVDFKDIRIPGSVSWEKAEFEDWDAVPYELWEVVKYKDSFYTLINLEDYDYLVNPFESDNWGKIGDYDETLDNYELSDHEYVVYNGMVFYPILPVNPDKLEENKNIVQHDPRNQNVKKHMLQIAVYEMHKLISPNNISNVRITDYENSIKWLQDASRLRLNPQIPRKREHRNGKEIIDWGVATFQREYDPYENPWQI